MPDHGPPFPNSDERTTLVAFLGYLRDSIVRKAEGVDDEMVRRPMVDSGTSLLGLVKHLTMAEVGWFQWTFAGRDVAIPALELEHGDTVDSVVADYQAAWAASNAVVEGCTDVEQRSARPGFGPEEMSLRWVLVHMVEETARHAGHADILREQIDGSTGR